MDKHNFNIDVRSSLNQTLDKYLSGQNNERREEIDPLQSHGDLQNENVVIEKKSTGATLESDQIFDEDGNFILPEKPLIIACLGKCGTGKSHLIKSMMYNYAKKTYFKFGIAIVPTKFNHSYDFINDKYVIENYSETYLKNYIDKLKNYKKTRGYLPPNFIILDDTLACVNLYSSLWTHLISTYRHLNLTIILGTQSLSARGGVSTLLRQMVNMAFLFRTVYKDTIKACAEAFGNLCDDYHEFEDMFLQTTSVKHTCLLFVNDKPSKEESYYSYIAPSSTPNFRLKF